MRLRRRFLQFFVFVSVTAAAQKAVPESFQDPESDAVDSVNPYVLYCLCRTSLIPVYSLIGNGGDSPNGSGGMIPSTAPPFAMTRWVAQTRQNYVSMTPYNDTDTSIHGFQVSVKMRKL